MKIIWIYFIVFTVLLVTPVALTESHALLLKAGPITADVVPCQTKTITNEWQVGSDSAKEITLKTWAEGKGSEFISFEQPPVKINPGEFKPIEFTVSVPCDLGTDKDIELKVDLYASPLSGTGEGVTLKERVLKIMTLNVGPNPDPSLREKDFEYSSPEPALEEQVTIPIEEKEEEIDIEPTGGGGLTIGSVEDGPMMDPEPVDESGQTDDDGSGGGCLIATAAFGSEISPQIQQLREVRDNVVLKTESGITFMNAFNQFYYSFSPTIADFERENQVFKETIKIAITPMLTTLSILNYVDINSEEEMLGYGIGVILLNIGTYFVAPAIVITKLKNKIR